VVLVVNILTAFELVLARGLVVYDAFGAENIVRRARGDGARAAALIGRGRVFFFAVVTTTVRRWRPCFVPLSILPGQAGGLFRVRPHAGDGRVAVPRPGAERCARDGGAAAA
jgi:HAE1 family hydrophobic/amphiphilic exporter-1